MKTNMEEYMYVYMYMYLETKNNDVWTGLDFKEVSNIGNVMLSRSFNFWKCPVCKPTLDKAVLNTF